MCHPIQKSYLENGLGDFARNAYSMLAKALENCHDDGHIYNENLCIWIIIF